MEPLFSFRARTAFRRRALAGSRHRCGHCRGHHRSRQTESHYRGSRRPEKALNADTLVFHALIATFTFDPCKALETRGGGRGSKLTLFETEGGIDPSYRKHAGTTIGKGKHDCCAE
jgi:hypothetical protein